MKNRSLISSGEFCCCACRKHLTPQQRAAHIRFVMKFQQCSGPIMAKGVEDTAFYVYNRLVALNEVGGKPEQFGIDPHRVPPP